MSLDDTAALRVLRDAFTGECRERVVGDFFSRFFAADPAARDLFPADMTAHRAAFAQALGWVYGELAEHRAREPVAFLAQLGRDHRKNGVTPKHYATVTGVLRAALRDHLGDRWTSAVATAGAESLELIAGVMGGASGAEAGPGWWEGTVVEHYRVSRSLAVVRLVLDQPLPYHPGQYVKVAVPQLPGQWRYLSPAIPADDGGGIEFHIRAVPGGVTSSAMVTETRRGDRWRLSAPHGGLHVDRDDGDVLMVAGSTGLAPLRAIVMDLARWAVNPRVHLFYGARYPCELYDLPTLWRIGGHNPWLSVTPVSEFTGNPPWAVDYPDPTPPRGLHVRQTGTLPDVVSQYGGWGDRQILICGNPGMVQATRSALIAKGTPPQRIQHDPLST